MIQKLIKKIKEHKLFRKFSCLTVACLLLFYMFSVSVFAAEGDDPSAQAQETESITDVWTAVMDGIKDLINAAQGLFVYPGEYFTSSVIVYEDGVDSYWLAPDLPFLDVGTSGFVVLNGVRVPFFVDYFSDDLLCFFISIDSASFPFMIYQEWPSSGYEGSFWGSIGSADPDLPSDFTLVIGSGGLTFLGTLAVLGVAIAVIMLLVYVVVSFIRLRG